MTPLKFFCAASLLAASSAFAATAPTAAPGTAQAESPATVPATTPAAPDHHCRNEANEKHLPGAARAAFIKKCRADTSAR